MSEVQNKEISTVMPLPRTFRQNYALLAYVLNTVELKNCVENIKRCVKKIDWFCSNLSAQ
jgi:hypothetical protein